MCLLLYAIFQFASVMSSRFTLHIRTISSFIKFLMGLNDTYGNAGSNLLMRLPLLTLNEAYSVLIQEESQRGITTSISLTNITMNTSLNSRANLTNQRRNNMGLRHIPTCQHCNKQVHLIENRWILHPELRNTGRPNGNFKSSLNGTQSYNPITDVSDTESTYNSTQSATNSSQSFTQEQYE